MDLRLFGSSAHPLRASGLAKMLLCPLRAVIVYLGGDSSGSAADTGSLVHAAIEHWHRRKDVKAALAHMRSRSVDFPKGDAHDAELSCLPYFKDPRNESAEIACLECVVTLELPCSVGGKIYVTGHVDQVRKENGTLCVWDVKSGNRFTGWEQVHAASLQLAAYTLGAEKSLGEHCEPGGVVRTYGYRVRGAELPSPQGVFFHAPFRRSDCEALLQGVSECVAMIRRGRLYASPGPECQSCPAGGLVNCLPKPLELGVKT